MKPSEKSDGMNRLLSELLGVHREESIKAEACVMCPAEDLEFRDEISTKEYTISGMCQACQDSIFN